MSFLLFLLFGAIAIALAIAYVIHIGAGARLGMIQDTLGDIARAGWSFVVRQYYDILVPAARALRFLALGLLALGAIYPVLILEFSAKGPTGWWTAILFATGAATAMVVYVTGKQGYFATGRVTIPVGGQQAIIQYPSTRCSPLIRVCPFNKDEGYELSGVTSTQFTLSLPAPATEAAEFRWTIREAEGCEPIVAVISNCFWTTLTMGILFFVAGVSSGDRAIVLMCIPFIAFAITLFFEVWHFFAWIARLTVDATEFLPNKTYSLASALMSRNMERIEEFFQQNARSDTQAFNLVNQEELEKSRMRAWWSVIAALISLIMIAVLVPHWIAVTILSLIMGIGAGIKFLYQYYINKALKDISQGIDRGEDLKKARAKLYSIEWRALVIYSTIAMILTGLVVAVLLFPALDPKVAVAYRATGVHLEILADEATKRISFILLMIGAISGLFLIWPKGQDDRLARFRKILAVPLGILAIFCMGRLIWSFVSDDVTNIAKATANGVLMEFTPSVTATKDGVAISWPEYPGNKGYRIMRRELHDTSFKPLLDGTGAAIIIDREAKHWEDTTPEQGKTYFYRVVALGAKSDGSNLTSEEQRVDVPLLDPPTNPADARPPASYVDRDSGSKPALPSGCVGRSCGMNPALDELCRRHPAACGSP